MRILAAALIWLVAVPCPAAPVHIENVRIWPAPDHTRVVFDVSGPLEHVLFSLDNPDRVVIDLRDARMKAQVGKPPHKDELVRNVRSAPRNRHDLRVVLDLRKPVRPKSFLLAPNRNYGHRLVVDLYGLKAAPSTAPLRAKPERPRPPVLRDVVIALDPGHGGEDPGAVGRRGTREKDVVFAVAKRLERLLKRQRGMRPVLIRRGDYYVGLRNRMELARKHRADLFVSIHADAFRDSRVYGSSVYVLSRNGASSEAAKWLADRENSADLAGGVSLDDKDDLLASVLLDLSQTATLSASADVGGKVLGELEKLGKTHKKSVQRAGFMVLKSPDIPSILVEIAFISNPHEERKLRNASHQDRVARAILQGVMRYFERNAPPGTLLAARKHTISPGETLSAIAQRYRVPLEQLRRANDLPGDHLRVGSVLQIPAGHGT